MTSIPLCACGCGNPTRIAPRTRSRLGWVKGQYTKFLPSHHLRNRTVPLKWGYPTASSTFSIWNGMMKRCFDPSHRAYKWYGGRGISVCERWHHFPNFLADMGERPEGKSIDRYPNPDGNYEPGNCRWATQKEQMRNSRSARFLTVNGETRTFREWEESLGLCRGIVHWRVKKGWPPEDCISASDAGRVRHGFGRS